MRYLILHINCPDQRGIIAQFTGILYDHGANVLNLEQHVDPDEKLFFMRIHADLKNMEITEEIRSKIRNIKLLLMDCDGVLTDGRLYYSNRKIKVNRFNKNKKIKEQNIKQNMKRHLILKS